MGQSDWLESTEMANRILRTSDPSRNTQKRCLQDLGRRYKTGYTKATTR